MLVSLLFAVIKLGTSEAIVQCLNWFQPFPLLLSVMYGWPKLAVVMLVVN